MWLISVPSVLIIVIQRIQGGGLCVNCVIGNKLINVTTLQEYCLLRKVK